MDKTIDFSNSKKRMEYKKNPLEVRSEYGCVPPVWILQNSYYSFNLFFCNLFDFNYVGTALLEEISGYKKKFRLYKARRIIDNYLKFTVVNDYYSKKKDVYVYEVNDLHKLLSDVSARLIKRAYLTASCANRNFTLYTYYKFDKQPVIDDETYDVLKNSGLDIENILDMTREELSLISGMSTSALFKLEASLASRGLFLKPSAFDEL